MRRKRRRDGETKRRGNASPPKATGLDRLDLYELAVTSVGPLARFLKAIHGGSPKVLGEDFSGTAALARAWVAMDRRHRAVAVDKDAQALARAAGPRIEVTCSDVLRVRHPCDIVAATNFPICYWHDRDDLIVYLRHVRTRLKRRGIFVADLYGGSDAFQTGSKVVRLRHGGQTILYTWEQRAADPISGRVLNAMHFRVGGRILRDAFVYDWRLWSIPELTDALKVAGFRTTEVYDELGGAVDGHGRLMVKPTQELSDPFVVYIVARR